MKSALWTAAALALSPTISSAAPPSPVGTWEVALSGADQGTAYVTFESDSDLTGYGISRNSGGIFTLSGTWSIDSSGRLVGSYTETLNGSTLSGSLTGKIAARRITGRISADNGAFSFSAKPAGARRDLSGAWSGVATVGKQRLPEIYQLTPSAYPHLYQIQGVGFSPVHGSYTITGAALAGAGGRVEIAVVSQGTVGAPVAAWLRGKGAANGQRSFLKGVRSNGERVTVSLRR